MSTHERQDIRQAAVTMLTGHTSAGTRVSSNRLAVVSTLQLPWLNVYIDSDTVDAASRQTAPRELTRTATLVVEGFVVADANVEDAIDALALEIETALDADPNFNGTAGDSVLTLTETAVKLEGARPLGVCRLEYAVEYHTAQRVNDPTNAFGKAVVDYSLGGVQAPADQTEDQVTIP